MIEQPRVAPDRRLSEAVLNTLMQWWKRIADESASGQDKADRAILKRCDSIEAVTRTAAYHRVYRAMRDRHEGNAWRSNQQDRLAMLVGLAAHVKTQGRGLAHEMQKRAKGSDRPLVSELRFRRLLDSPDDDSLFVALRRAVLLVDHQLDLDLLARDVFTWGDSVKKSWAYDYYTGTLASVDDTA